MSLYTPIAKYSLRKEDINNYVIRHKQCRQLGDNYYIVSINPYVNELLKTSLPIITIGDTLDDGIYIYIVLGLGKEPPVLYMIKTLTMYEFGTKHQQLVHRIACTKNKCKKYNIYYAGELIKLENNISFNFYSGTFKMENINQHDIEFITELISSFEPGLNINFINEPIITDDNLILTDNDLQMFNSFGAIVYKFDNLDECMSYVDYFNVSASYPPPTKKLPRLKCKMYGGKKTKKQKLLV